MLSSLAWREVRNMWQKEMHGGEAEARYLE